MIALDLYHSSATLSLSTKQSQHQKVLNQNSSHQSLKGCSIRMKRSSARPLMAPSQSERQPSAQDQPSSQELARWREEQLARSWRQLKDQLARSGGQLEDQLARSWKHLQEQGQLSARDHLAFLYGPSPTSRAHLAWESLDVVAGHCSASAIPSASHAQSLLL